MFIEITILLSMIFLLAGSYIDLRTGEIPEWLSRGYIFTIFLLSLISSVLDWSINPVGMTLLVGFFYFSFGYITCELGQWGGGDMKILAGIGLSLGLLHALNYPFPNSAEIPHYLGYFLNMGIVMVPYVFFYGLALGVRDSRVAEEYVKSLKKIKFIFAFILSFVPFLIALYFGLVNLYLFYLVIPFFLLVSVYLKVLEKTALIERVSVARLREGDVIAEDFVLGKKKISARNINGLSQEEIDEIKKLAKDGKFPGAVNIKYGVKSVPILMLAFVLLVYYGNFLELMIL